MRKVTEMRDYLISVFGTVECYDCEFYNHEPKRACKECVYSCNFKRSSKSKAYYKEIAQELLRIANKK